MLKSAIIYLAVVLAAVGVLAQDEFWMNDGEPEEGGIMQLMRNRRQIVDVSQQQAPAKQSGVLSFLSDLGPQLSTAQSLSSLFKSSAEPQQQTQQQSVAQAAQLMSQLTEMVRSAQGNTAKATSGAQQSIQQAGQQAQQGSIQAAQSAQGGIQAALSEIGQGLQRIATNNPSLLPDVKNLYQSVSSKLSSASSSVQQAANPALSSSIQPAKNQEQLADNLAKLAVPGLQTPVY